MFIKKVKITQIKVIIVSCRDTVLRGEISKLDNKQKILNLQTSFLRGILQKTRVKW